MANNGRGITIREKIIMLNILREKIINSVLTKTNLYFGYVTCIYQEAIDTESHARLEQMKVYLCGVYVVNHVYTQSNIIALSGKTILIDEIQDNDKIVLNEILSIFHLN